MSDTKQGRLSDKAEQALLQQIHSGELPVGAKLPSEPILAKEMGLSRGILREALNSLQAKGYISRTPRGGSYVTRTADNHIGDSITAKVRSAELRDLIEFREALEVKIVQYAIKRATQEEIDSLRALVEQPGEQYGSKDYYFQYRLAELAKNTLFVMFLDMYYDIIRRYALHSYHNEHKSSAMNMEHMRIVETIQKRDKRAAVNAVKGHLGKALRRLLEDSDV